MFFHQRIGLISIIVCLFVLPETKACFKRKERFKKCPFESPYAYLDGSYCCKHSVEAFRSNIGDNPSCNGGPLELNSHCCKGDEFVPCPHGEKTCRSSIRGTCYLDGEMVTSYQNIKTSVKQLCMALTESGGDPEAEVEWVMEFLEGKEWQLVETCERVGKEKIFCNIGRAIHFLVNSHGSGGDSANTKAATAGVSTALALAPQGKRCKLPRKWRTIRGKQKCRRPIMRDKSADNIPVEP